MHRSGSTQAPETRACKLSLSSKGWGSAMFLEQSEAIHNLPSIAFQASLALLVRQRACCWIKRLKVLWQLDRLRWRRKRNLPPNAIEEQGLPLVGHLLVHDAAVLIKIHEASPIV